MAMENQNDNASHVYNFNAPVGQFIEHVDTVNFSLDGNGHFQFHNVGEVNGQPQETAEPAKKEKRASKEMMSHAMIETLRGGYWKSARSWAIVYAIYQIWGYKGRMNDFICEVATWPDTMRNEYTCNRDAVSKLCCKYFFSKDIDEWRGEGVPEQYCILGEKLNEELEILWAQKGA